MKSSHSNLRAHRVFAAIAAIFTTYAHAILDTNTNGLSDVWEKQHNTNQLFSNTNPDHTPTADPDQDDWTNAQEALAGTNPFDGSLPNGKTTLTIQAAPQAATYELTWSIIPGKNYRIQASTNLHFWANIGPIIHAEANQNTRTLDIQATDPDDPNATAPPPRLFYRVKVTDDDEDGDGLTNYEEYVLGINPQLSDTDGDGISDFREIQSGTSPVNPDTDGDGTNDNDENHFGTNPLLGNNSPYMHAHALRSIQYTSIASNGDPAGYISLLNTWDEELEQFINIEDFKPLQELRDMLDAVAFPVEPTQYELNPEEENVLESTASSDMPERNENVYLSGRRIWTVLPEIAQAQCKFHFLVRNQVADNAMQFTTSYDKREQYLLAGEQHSEPLDIEPVPSGGLQNESRFVATVKIIPVQLLTDLDNDGIINQKDITRREIAQNAASGSEEEIRRTEFMFVNDNLSNGLWDVGDTTDPERPASETNDDDVEALAITCDITEGEVWLEHPAIAGLSFYKTAECKEAIGMKSGSRFNVELSHTVPKIIYVRADVEIPYPESQIEGDLVLKFREKINGEFKEEQTAMTLKLTVVKQLGATKYFHAIRDYILENNTKTFTHEKLYGTNTKYRIVGMREESSQMFTYDSYDHVADAPRLKGIDEVKANFNSDVIINGNQCFFHDDRNPYLAAILKQMTNRCDGRLCAARHIMRPPSDDTHNAALGGITGRYVAYTSGEPEIINGQVIIPSDFAFETGPIPEAVPTTPDHGIGGLAAKYDKTALNDGSENHAIGRGPVIEEGKGVIFTATNYVNSQGKAIELAADARKSGVKPLNGGDGTMWELLFLDGSSSVGLVLADPSNIQRTVIKGDKHNGRYYINTYLLFECKKVRN